MNRSPENVGSEIRHLRTTAGVGLRVLARRLGVSAPHLSNIERGYRRPSTGVLKRVARELRSAGATYQGLVELNTRVEPAMRRWVENTPRVARLLERLRELPQRDELLPLVLEAFEDLTEEARSARRFQRIGLACGVEVVKSLAYTPAKIASVIETARRRARRVLAVYEPHGYGPTRFLRNDLVEVFATSLQRKDRLWMLEIFSMRGTADPDFSAADLVTGIVAKGTAAEFVPSREELIRRVSAEAREGDLVLVVGALDPSLVGLAHSVLHALAKR